MAKDNKCESSVQSLVLRNNDASRVVTFENAYFINIRNLGKNDAYLISSSDQRIFVPGEGGNPSPIQIYLTDNCPLNESWVAEFPFGDSEIHVLYSYTKTIKKLV